MSHTEVRTIPDGQPLPEAEYFVAPSGMDMKIVHAIAELNDQIGIGFDWKPHPPVEGFWQTHFDAGHCVWVVGLLPDGVGISMVVGVGDTSCGGCVYDFDDVGRLALALVNAQEAFEATMGRDSDGS